MAGVFTQSDFLLLLEKLLIISSLSPSEYFFPAVLNTTPESEVHKILDCHKVKGIAPLAVQFHTSWAPSGVYCCSVCHLHSFSHWEVVHKSPTSTSSSKDIPQLPHFSRNSITFTKRGRPGSVTFIDIAFFIVCLNMDTRKIKQEGLVKLPGCQDRAVCCSEGGSGEHSSQQLPTRASLPVPLSGLWLQF